MLDLSRPLRLRWRRSFRAPPVVPGLNSRSLSRLLVRLNFALKNARWLPWLAFPIGVESGFSSAGAGALGTVLLLNYSEMAPAQVVGTDIAFGLVLAIIGIAVHWTFGSISTPILLELLAGGVPGVVLGCLLARKVPARKLRAVVAAVAICAGLQLVWSGARTLVAKRTNAAARLTVQAPGALRP